MSASMNLEGETCMLVHSTPTILLPVTLSAVSASAGSQVCWLGPPCPSRPEAAGTGTLATDGQRPAQAAWLSAQVGGKQGSRQRTAIS